MTAILPGKLRCCQNVGCRTLATKQYKLQSGKYQWRCDQCNAKRTKGLLTRKKD